MLNAIQGPRARRAQTACGVVAGPLFVGAFTAIGTRRRGYDWRRHAVSSLADGRAGWFQRANFMIAGALYCIAARGLARTSRRPIESPVASTLVLGAGVGLIGSGVFVTDPIAGFPPDRGSESAPPASSRSGILHNLFALPIFVGIPVAALACSVSAARRHETPWAGYSAASAVAMVGSFVLFGAGLGGDRRFSAQAGVFQRISIATGFAWVSGLALRAWRIASR